MIVVFKRKRWNLRAFSCENNLKPAFFHVYLLFYYISGGLSRVGFDYSRYWLEARGADTIDRSFPLAARLSRAADPPGREAPRRTQVACEARHRPRSECACGALRAWATGTQVPACAARKARGAGVRRRREPLPAARRWRAADSASCLPSCLQLVEHRATREISSRSAHPPTVSNRH